MTRPQIHGKEKPATASRCTLRNRGVDSRIGLLGNTMLRNAQVVARKRISQAWLLVLGFMSAPIGLFSAPIPATETLAAVQQKFQHPPDDARIMMRWWWFGTAVQKPELERELRVMKDAGIGGVEIQPVYPLQFEGNLPYLSDGYLDALHFTAETTHRLGMRFDVTLGSGWPFGGPHTPVTEAAGRLRCERASGSSSVPMPAMEDGESLIAAFMDGKPSQEIKNGGLQLPPGTHQVLFFISSRTGQQVKRAAIGAEGFVLDHYSQTAIEHHLTAVGDKLIKACSPNLPHSVFSDSLEVFGTDWTPDFLQQFRKRRAYDLTPDLPALVDDVGPETAAIRHDWAETLTELADDNYLTPIRQWAHAHGTLFRSQTYGEPPVMLSSNALVDLPEGEHGPEWRQFSPARWASSASHLYGRPVTSSETWTWLHSPAFRATPLDMKAEADLHFIQGINQLVGHGWPYSPASAGEPGWRFYAAAAFNQHNPWFQVMPDITKYLQRVSYLMRQGEPVKDVAIYLPTDDAWAHMKPGQVSIDRSMDGLLGPNVIADVLNAGHSVDFIDDLAIAHAGIGYKLLIIPGPERMPLSTLHAIEAFKGKGGLVVATRRLPSLAPGFQDRGQSAAVEKDAKKILGDSLVQDESGLPRKLAQMLPPDFGVSGEAAPAIGFAHRKLADADIYFVANTSNQSVETDAHVAVQGRSIERWDPFTGTASAGSLHLQLAPYESTVLVFSSRTAPQPRSFHEKETVDLSQHWTVTFPDEKPAEWDGLHSWTDEERFFSGSVNYERDVKLDEAQLKDRLFLNFGQGTLIPAPSKQGPGMRALLESPVRESAVVFVNGQRAGTVWRPPYQLEVTRFLKPGTNNLRVVVANTAMNEMAGAALPSYKLLNLRYGTRFVPQTMEDVAPLPSGLLGPVRLIVERESN